MRQVVSAHHVFLRNKERPNRSARLVLGKAAPLSNHASFVIDKTENRFIGVLGSVIVITIFGLGVYFVVKYLL